MLDSKNFAESQPARRWTQQVNAPFAFSTLNSADNQGCLPRRWAAAVMQIEKVQCRSILTRTGGYLRPVCSHTMNPYAGCGFGGTLCGVGCYVRANSWLLRGRVWGRFLEVKQNAAAVYRQTCAAEQRWARRRGGPFSIFLASSTEPWQPAEREFRITRGLLEAMLECPPEVLILQTHSSQILEDRERIHALSHLTKLRVHISIESDRDRLPGLPGPPCSVAGRMEAVRMMAKSGVFSVVCVSPLHPIEQPDRFFRALAECGAGAVVIDHFIGGDGTRLGARTLKTDLPRAMERLAPESVALAYRDAMAAVARRYLPTGLSAAGFAGHYE
ncbi:MAG: hypothetical protein ACE5ER_11510 [Nitrospinaceae bacterium]